MDKRKQKIQKAMVDLPYKSKASSMPITEDTQKAERMFGNKYDMILAASARSYELARGATPLVEGGHRSAVTALLEIEAGFITAESLKIRK